MLDDIKEWIKSRSSESVRIFIVVFTSLIFLTRLFIPAVRNSVDILNVVLFSVIILAILRNDIRDLIRKMKGVGFPGLQIPIEELDLNLTELESVYSQSIRKYSDNKEFLNKQKINQEEPPHHSLSNISIEIENELEDIAHEFVKLSDKEDVIPVHSKNLTKYLLSRDVIGKDVYQLVKIFWEVKSQNPRENEEKKLQEIGVRLLRLLEVVNQKLKDLKIVSSSNGKPFSGKPQGIRLGGLRIEETKEKLIAIYTTVNLIDNLETAYPIVALRKENFSITETYQNGDAREVLITKVEALENTIPLTIVIAIDVSGSMKDDNKLKLAKQAAINLVNKLTTYSNPQNLKIFILPFSGNIKNRFISFTPKRNWSNNSEEIKKEILKLKAGGGTPLYDALAFSMNSIKDRSGYKYIICLTDGEATKDNIKSEADIYSMGEKIEIPIYTIGYGKDEYFRFLVKLSKITNAGELGIGAFMKVSPSKLNKVFGYLSGSLAHSYGIYWKPSKTSKGTIVKFDIKVQFETSFGKVEVERLNNQYKLK